MGFGKPGRRNVLYLSGIAILIAGLVCAALVYKAAVDSSNMAQAYESGDGTVLPSPDNSKQYLRELQLYGGAANVLAYELRTWFSGLWQGKSLACMIIFITILVASTIFHLARRLPSRTEADSRREGDG